MAVVCSIGLASSAWAKPHHYRHDPYARAAAAYAILLDGQMLWGRNLDEPRAPASLTKLLTALVLLDSNWNPDEMLTVSHEAAHVIPSKVGLHTGDRISARDALTAMLVHSANDACMVLVEHAAPSLPEFAARMNARAEQLGMHESHFVHPCGFDEPDQHSTVNDLLRLAQAAHADPRIARIVAQEQATVTIESTHKDRIRVRQVSFHSTNHLLGHLPGVMGLKTGYTAQAGRCLIALAEHSGHRVWVVLLDSRQRWWMAHRLITAAFASTDRHPQLAGTLAGAGT
jgi:D-alanyl-D-alanine carboxypeptidase (penicillin-binding protein 5/6)